MLPATRGPCGLFSVACSCASSRQSASPALIYMAFYAEVSDSACRISTEEDKQVCSWEQQVLNRSPASLPAINVVTQVEQCCTENWDWRARYWHAVLIALMLYPWPHAACQIASPLIAGIPIFSGSSLPPSLQRPLGVPHPATPITTSCDVLHLAAPHYYHSLSKIPHAFCPHTLMPNLAARPRCIFATTPRCSWLPQSSLQ